MPEDAMGFCILHSLSESKDPRRFDEAFWDDFEGGGADFRCIRFPAGFQFKKREIDRAINFSKSHFRGSVDFSKIHFVDEVHFANVVFHDEADFSEITVDGWADFRNAGFENQACFRGATFAKRLTLIGGYSRGQIYFSGAEFESFSCQQREFESSVHFDAAHFAGSANFMRATFEEDFDLNSAVFDKWVNLREVDVNQKATFSYCTFNSSAVFRETQFHGKASFALSQFDDRALFTRTTFEQEAAFQNAAFKEATFDSVEFEGPTSFERCDFGGPTFFEGVRFKESVMFTRSAFRDRALFAGSKETSFIFAEAQVDCIGLQLDPGVIFHIRMADLRKCQFADTDLRRIEFSTVKWPKIEMSWYKIRYRRSGLYDEHILNDGKSRTEAEHAKAKKVERLYRALKQNYEERRDYPAAGDFHIGEKETQRRTTASWPKRKLLGIYRAISLYGERATPSFVMLVVTILLFAAIYAGIGLQEGSTAPAIYLTKAPIASLWHGFLYSLQVTAFSRPEAYELMWSGGVLVSIAQRAVTTTLIALFALAIRQQLKR